MSGSMALVSARRVPVGESCVSEAWVDGSSALAPVEVERPLAQVIELYPRVPEVRTRLTARGRLVILLGALFLAALAALAVFGAADATSGGEVARVAVVTSETSLSEIGARELPQLPAREAVAVLQGFNDLPTREVRAGQKISIPRL